MPGCRIIRGDRWWPGLLGRPTRGKHDASDNGCGVQILRPMWLGSRVRPEELAGLSVQRDDCRSVSITFPHDDIGVDVTNGYEARICCHWVSVCPEQLAVATAKCPSRCICRPGYRLRDDDSRRCIEPHAITVAGFDHVVAHVIRASDIPHLLAIGRAVGEQPRRVLTYPAGWRLEGKHHESVNEHRITPYRFVWQRGLPQHGAIHPAQRREHCRLRL